MKRSFSHELFHQMPLVGILRGFPAAKMTKIAAVYAKAGLTTLEITMNTQGATDTIADLIAAVDGKLNVGAGTVCNMEDLDKALTAGAQFIVAPIMDEEVIRKCVTLNVPVFPGAYTPTEIYKAWSLGATMVKVFPAGKLGPGYLKEVLAPLNQIQLLPTGGISLDNMAEFIKAGAKGFGIGSALIPKQLVEQEAWEELHQHFVQFVTRYKTFLNEN
ncbi:MAG TPA: bifunctional 4-hydroxy-2-oxoglutarate aldolase/2-dehydro-3-deoxy-phosphogluconate aldolase [Cyclobacteriaceae bacterium]|nr:bifunctional 4-hydroxy-2-oxoglutarate aldolase/2-dehydro-3-deoxy-phosphogluconate aldolase [Cyclobacteriaceae bacterium]